MLSGLPKIVINNEDNSYQTFMKLLTSNKFLDKNITQLRCKKAPTKTTSSNKFKKVQLDFIPHEGEYEFDFKGDILRIVIEKAENVLTSQCRMIDSIKSVSIFAHSVEKAKNFVSHVFSFLDQESDENMITIYENNGGYWRISKQKLPRKLESVIFEKQFIENILNDINQFIQSEQWYTEMGIPYKRSYLFYGPPGTGKSSLAQAIAAEIKFSICFVNCSDKINDFNFNSLLNQAPKKSVILIQDVDSIFRQRKNAEKVNALTFSGFLNAIDGVRSQEGRIIIMTTNYKDRLDPALLRPGRVDQMYCIGLSSCYQIEKMCLRFYKNQQIATQFAKRLPQKKLPMSMIQGFLVKYRKKPNSIIDKIDDLLNSDENVKIDQYLQEINCQEMSNDFKIEQCYTLASAKNLTKEELQHISTKLSPLLKGRLHETLRVDRKNYLKSDTQILHYIEQSVKDEIIERTLKQLVKVNKLKTLYQVRDKIKELEQQNKTQPSL